MDLKNVKNQFLQDVQNHTIQIVMEDKENFIRHIRYRGDSFNCWFDIITWKGSFCINGDHGTYVFSRIEDMFEFFRTGVEKFKINPSYWAEKIQSEAIYGGGVKKFSVKKFEANVKYDFETYYEDSEDEKTKKLAWEDIKNQLIGCEDEHSCIESLNAFNSEYYEFNDFWEYSHNEYTFHYIWCLYAIVYGITLYDKQ